MRYMMYEDSTGPTFMTIASAIRDAFAPDMSDNDLRFLIVDETGAPSFFDGEPVAQFVSQISLAITKWKGEE